jgi:glutaredoxin
VIAWSKRGGRALSLISLGLGLGGVAAPVTAQNAAPQQPVLEVFALDGCPHCSAALKWLEGIRVDRPDLDIRLHIVNRDPVARDRLIALARERGLAAVGPMKKPSFHFGSRFAGNASSFSE